MQLGIGHLAHAVVRTQDQVRHSDVEPAVQPCVSAPDRVDPAERHREPADRLPVQVVIELAVVVAVQRGAVAALGRRAGHQLLAEARYRADRCGADGAQDRRALQVQPRAVQDKAVDVLGGGGAATPQPVQPQRHDQTARRVAVQQHLRPAGGRDDDVERALQLDVVAGQVGGEVRSLAFPPGSAALVQVERVEGKAAVDEVVGHLGVEEVVGEPVHQQYGVPGGVVLIACANQGGHQIALAVGIGAERQRLLPVARQYVGLPGSHVSYLNRGQAARLGPTPAG